MIRQGDVLVVKCDADLDLAEPVPLEGGRIILAHGEATGHAHAIRSKRAALYSLDGDRYLRVDATVTLRHEEHAPHAIKAGTYKVIRQVEYTPEEVRNVAD